MAESLRRDAQATVVERHELLSAEEMGRLRVLRHFAEHIDKEVVAGGIGPETPLNHYPRAGCIEYASLAITYRELATWIVRLNELAARLMDHAPEQK